MDHAVRVPRGRLRQSLRRHLASHLVISGMVHLTRAASSEGPNDFMGTEAFAGKQLHVIGTILLQ
jgi:hypothetical protein